MVVIAFAMFVSDDLYAQEKPVRFMFGVGGNEPTAPVDFRTAFKFGFNFGTGLYFPISESFRIGTEANYHQFGLSDEALPGAEPDFFSARGSEIRIITAMLNVRYVNRSQENLSPFFELGGGLIRRSIDNLGVDDNGQYIIFKTRPETNFGINTGAGMEFRLKPKLHLILSYNYNLAFTEGASTQFVPIKARLAFRIN